MAKRSIVTLVDDLDGTVLDPGFGETVRFAVDGRSYEIDLTDDNAALLREKLRPFAESARRLTKQGARRGRRT